MLPVAALDIAIHAYKAQQTQAITTPRSAVFLWFLISLLLGGTSGASSHDIAVDREGTVYVTGQTSSAHYPTTAAFDTTLDGADAFVTNVRDEATNRLSGAPAIGRRVTRKVGPFEGALAPLLRLRPTMRMGRHHIRAVGYRLSNIVG